MLLSLLLSGVVFSGGLGLGLRSYVLSLHFSDSVAVSNPAVSLDVAISELLSHSSNFS